MSNSQRAAQLAVGSVGVAAIIATATGHGELFEQIMYDLLYLYYVIIASRNDEVKPPQG